MNKIDKDIKRSKRIMNNIRTFKYNSIYNCSNENLKDIFSNIDVCGKNVLSVLGSGDQALHIYNNGANSVDVFDRNELSFYYFYLRLWSIKYLNCFYPQVNFQSIKKILDCVAPISYNENCAYDYWLQLLIRCDASKIDNLFFTERIKKINKIQDLSKVKKILEDDMINFYSVDISRNVEDIKKRYDVLYVSNIFDYIKKNVHNIERYRDNLYSLLNESGIVISTDVSKRGGRDLERRIFEDMFSYEAVSYNSYDNFPSCYVYTRDGKR